jgi:mono/diheme cytochrome c family protein
MILVALVLAQAAPDGASVARGERVFQQNCAVGYCHGAGGAASRGPRLKEREFARDFLEKVVRHGIPQTAMPGFGGRLEEAELKAAIDYVASLSSVTGSAAGPASPPPVPVAEFDAPPEIRRGRDLFFDATRGTRCGTCHALGGMGVAVGPNLARLSPAQVKAVVESVRTSKPRLVRTVRLHGGESFPAVAADVKAGRFFDLTTTPPVLRSIDPGQLVSADGRSSWSHTVAAKNYSADEVEAIARYIRWMNFGQ